ncbi:phosphatidylglycerophosphatase A [Candidatus Peregrinibacteria bacterium]|nr:phosphatidylglycerophosphatase A [Candidatus Peregrinibacteria bacterium]
MKRLARLLLSCGGIGFLPKGSWMTATVAGFLLPWFFAASPAPFTLRAAMFLAAILVLLLMGGWAIPLVRAGKKHDHEWIVLDEVLGVLIAASPFLFFPQDTIHPLIAGVVTTGVFGFFDGLKPLGIQRIDDAEHIPITVMLDDVVAGVYAAGVILVGQRIVGGW